MSESELLDALERIPRYLIKVSLGGQFNSVQANTAIYDDLLQSVRLQILRAVKTYDPSRGSLLSYVKQHAVHTIHKVLNAERFSGNQIATHDYNAIPAAFSLNNNLESLEMWEYLAKILTRTDYAILERKYKFSQTNKQIAADYGYSTSAVYFRLEAILKKLRRFDSLYQFAELF